MVELGRMVSGEIQVVYSGLNVHTVVVGSVVMLELRQQLEYEIAQSVQGPEKTISPE
jgi:hypothetical protein